MLGKLLYNIFNKIIYHESGVSFEN
jgi:hypothetical protein